MTMKVKKEYIVEAVADALKKSDVMDIINKDKNFEKRVKSIITDVLVDLFRVLYQHNGIYKSLSR